MKATTIDLLRRFIKKSVSKNYFFAVLLFIATTTQAKTYYVSETGNDGNDGLSPATSWKTIVKVNSVKFKSDDRILFKRGDTFYGGIIVKRDDLNFGAYGTGSKPVITGLSTVIGWVNLGGNIWEAPVTNVKNGVNLVLRNGAIQQVGRYPNGDAENGGYITYTAASTNSITVPALSSTTDWTDAEVAIRHNRWDITKQKIKRHSGNVLTFTGEPEAPRLNYGCFFQRDARTLDEDGEWWYNDKKDKLRMYFTSNNPNSFNIQIATVDTLFKNRHFNNLTITDLAFYGSGKRTIWTNGGTGISIKNCDVTNSGAEAITCLYSIDVTIDNCRITNSLGSGIRVLNNDKKASNAEVTNCIVTNTAYIAGMETSGDFNSGAGIACERGDGINIHNNTITNSGYAGISWQGDNVSIKYNFVNIFCTQRDDGGGIYTVENAGSNLPSRTNRKIIGNIILNGRGNNNGTNNPKGTSCSGLYFDLGTRTVLADSNTVAYTVNSGFHGNNNSSLTITNNIFFRNGKGYSLQRFAGAPLVRNLVVKKNIVYPYRFYYGNSTTNIPVINKEADLLAMGTFDNNYYSLRSGTDTSYFGIATNADGTNYKEVNNPFSYLTGTVGIEKNSINVVNTGTLEYNASNSPKIVQFSGLSKKDVFGNVYNNSVTIAAWKSMVLIPNGTVSSANKAPIANAGNNQTILLPTNAVTLTGGGLDEDGTIAEYSWTKVSGPQTGSIVSPLSSNTVLFNLSAGVYQYELTVTDNDGATGKDTIQINVNFDLLPAVDPANTVNGLDYKYYEGAWFALPSFSSLTADDTGTVSNFDISPAKIRKGFGFSFTGFINVPSDGFYTFYTLSDDGSELYIDNVLTVSNGGVHGRIEKSGVIGLEAGKHAITGLYFQRGGGSIFTVSYESDNFSKLAVPSSALFRINKPTAVKISNARNRIAVGPIQNNDHNNSNNTLKINIYPNPFNGVFDLFVQGKSNDKIVISVLDVYGKIIFNTQGGANKHYILGDNFPVGIYIIKVMQGNNIQTLKVVKQ